MNRQKGVCQTIVDVLLGCGLSHWFWAVLRRTTAFASWMGFLVCCNYGQFAYGDGSEVSRAMALKQRVQVRSNLPRALSRLEWNSSLQRFSGTTLFEVRSGAGLTLALFANRALHIGIESRNDREFNAVGFPGEDIWSMNRSGGLLIRSVNWLDQIAAPCNMANQNDLRLLQDQVLSALPRRPAIYELNRFETLLRVKAAALPAKEPKQEMGNQKCSVLEVQYDFFPPRTEGNFGFQSVDRQTYSGPVAPLAIDELYNNSLLISGISASCLGCETVSEAETRQQFIGMPTPLHLGSNESVKVETLYLANFKVGIVGEIDSGIKDSLVNLLAEYLEKWNSNAALPRIEPGPGGFHFFVGAKTLKERLVFAQTGELQSGPGLLKVSALFSKYHRAAFARELIILLLQKGLNQGLLPTSWQENHIVSALAQYQARELLMEWFDDLESLKVVSSKFSFIPLFDDILAGKALQNNEVFLGEQETPTKVDGIAAISLFPTLTGKQINERLNYCLSQSQVSAVKSLVSNLQSGTLDLRDFIEQLDQIGSTNCEYKVSALLRDSPVKEVFVASKLETRSGWLTFKFSRQDSASGDDVYFDQDGLPTVSDKMGKFYDTPRVRITDREQNKILYERVWARTIQGSQQALGSGYKKDETLSSKEMLEKEFEENSSAIGAAIEGPTNGSNLDRHVIPRKFKFLISGLKMSYDSKEEFVGLQTGVQFKLLGDEYQRSLVLGLNLDNKKLELLGGFSLDLIGLFVGLSPRPQDEASANLAGVLFNNLPLSLGLQNSSRFGNLEKNTTSAVVSIGVENRNANKIVPSGYAFKYKLARQLLEQSSYVPLLSQQVSADYDQAIGTLTTLSFAPVFGISDEGVLLSDYVPGSSMADANGQNLQVKRFLVLNSQLKGVVLTGFNFDLLGSLLFQDLVVYGAHHFGSDLSIFRKAEDFSIALQTIEVGFQLFGSFFGAKNQSLAFSFFRTLTRDPSNSFSVTVGRN